MERDWIDYVSAFGNAATVLTLIFVLIKEYKTRKDIQDLTVIAKELQRQNHLQAMQMKNNVKPEVAASSLWLEKSTGFGYNSFGLSIDNHGQTLEVTRIINHVNNDNFPLQPIDTPFQFTKHQPVVLRFISFQKSPKNIIYDYDIEMSVTDIYNNRYMVLIKGNDSGNTVEIHEDEDEETANGMI